MKLCKHFYLFITDLRIKFPLFFVGLNFFPLQFIQLLQLDEPVTESSRPQTVKRQRGNLVTMIPQSLMMGILGFLLLLLTATSWHLEEV